MQSVWQLNWSLFQKERIIPTNQKKGYQRLTSSGHHIFGICIDLLTIRQPLTRNMPTTGWNSNKVPGNITPSGRSSKIQPWDSQYAIIPTMTNVVGMGVPSKYFDFPVLSLGSVATVTLNRASLVRPQRTKIVSRTWSTGDLIPIENAATAGETPNETYTSVRHWP